MTIFLAISRWIRPIPYESLAKIRPNKGGLSLRIKKGFEISYIRVVQYGGLGQTKVILSFLTMHSAINLSVFRVLIVAG